MPYGLIVCELGTTYADDEGGIADWVRRAFGDKWGSRVSWYYWINFPLWMASLAFLFPETISMITGMEIGLVPSLAIELAFIWIVVFLSFSKVSDSAWILNLAAVLKVGIALVVGGLGIWYAVNFGFANDMAPETFLPALDSNSLTYLSIILFNFMGFEVITTYVGSMENPNKQIPRAIIAGGIAIAALYLFSSFGIGAAIPAMDISLDSGIMDAVTIPVMAKARIGHIVEARILESLGVDYIDESEVLTPADDRFHIDKRDYTVPFVCGARNLGEALRRIAEGASMIRTKGEPGTGNVVEAVRHCRMVLGEVRALCALPEEEVANFAKENGAPLELVLKIRAEGRLPVVNFAAGGIATPADAALMMQLGLDGVFVGSGIFKSTDPAKRAKAIVAAVTHYNDYKILAEVSRDLGEAMPGLEISTIAPEQRMQERGW